MPTGPRFLIIDLHQRIAVPATTDDMQALVLWREELRQPDDAAYIGLKEHPATPNRKYSERDQIRLNG